MKISGRRGAVQHAARSTVFTGHGFVRVCAIAGGLGIKKLAYPGVLQIDVFVGRHA